MGGRNAPGVNYADETGGRKLDSDIDGYLYADRGIYRPGETVHLNALLRDREARAVKDRKGFIVVRRPSGVEFIRYRFDKTPVRRRSPPNLALPKSAPRGRWRASVEIEGLEKPAGELAFAVEDFAPQRLAVTAKGNEQVPLPPARTRRAIEVNARFLYGAAGAGLQTQGEARLRVDPDPFPQFKDYRVGRPADRRSRRSSSDLETTVTDGEGRAALHLPAVAARRHGPAAGGPR